MIIRVGSSEVCSSVRRRLYSIGGPDYAPEPLWPTMSKLLSQEAVLTGIMVAMRLEGPILCPSFACCDGVVVFSADGAIDTFPAGPAYAARAIYDVTAERVVERLTCGSIPQPHPPPPPPPPTYIP